jgi:ABC-type bacteriocin/lantibiotic exporter with double-glycine peptidase domain
MLALLKPVEGLVTLYDAHREVDASPATRCNLVYVPQGNTLFSGTVRENLLMGNPEATETQMVDALRTAVADFVLELPGGLDTRCGEGGAGLSEGQAQRIAIARGLLRPGSILLLDEFSSSLDPATEAQLMENLTKKAAGKTMIFITHREKIAQYCERTCPVQRLA